LLQTTPRPILPPKENNNYTDTKISIDLLRSNTLQYLNHSAFRKTSFYKPTDVQTNNSYTRQHTTADNYSANGNTNRIIKEYIIHHYVGMMWLISLGLKEWRGKTMKTRLCRLVFGSIIYNIWRNRNTLRHGNNP
jgi:hypothetical protein